MFTVLPHSGQQVVKSVPNTYLWVDGVILQAGSG